MYYTPSPPYCPTSIVYTECISPGILPAQNAFIINRFCTFYGTGKKRTGRGWTYPMLGRCLSQSEKRRWWKKALNAILFIAAAWALEQEPIHSRRRRGGGHSDKMYEPAHTNSSFELNRQLSVLSSQGAVAVISTPPSKRLATDVSPRCWRSRSAQLPATTRRTRCLTSFRNVYSNV